MNRPRLESIYAGREGFFRLLEEEAERARHLSRPLTILRVEAPGVRNLVELARVYRAVAGALRTCDRICSLGGHELAVVLADTDAHRAEAPCERVRAALRIRAAGLAPRLGAGHISAGSTWQEAWRMAGALLLADGTVPAAA